VALVEMGTSAVIDAVLAAAYADEHKLAARLATALRADTLLLADRGSDSARLYAQIATTGAAFLVRCGARRVPPRPRGPRGRDVPQPSRRRRRACHRRRGHGAVGRRPTHHHPLPFGHHPCPIQRCAGTSGISSWPSNAIKVGPSGGLRARWRWGSRMSDHVAHDFVDIDRTRRG
jgi:hypothetical protein